MLQLHVYHTAEDLPALYEWQIRSFLRIIWYAPNEEDLNEPLTAAELHPVFFILAKGDMLISYTRLIWMKVSHVGQTFKMYGLGDVFTFPASRGRGYGRQIVQAAADYLHADPEADAAILLTEPALEGFYHYSGWEHIPAMSITVGERDNPRKCDDFPMMLFLSQKARQMRSAFETEPIFLPGDEW
jgi:GNAT superfamily N-acetyltransferase